jgi:hypothetical protein
MPPCNLILRLSPPLLAVGEAEHRGESLSRMLVKLQLVIIFNKYLLPFPDNHGHRTAIRAALASDQNWISTYLSKMLTMLDKQVTHYLIVM